MVRDAAARKRYKLLACYLGRAKFRQARPSQTKQNQGKPRKTKEKMLGFPWILSSESRLFNGLRRLRSKNSSRASYPRISTVLHVRPARYAWATLVATETISASGQSTIICDFQQRIVAQLCRLGRRPDEARALSVRGVWPFKIAPARCAAVRNE
jgi:hypothetical protein